jgi:CubicO group peptidase (beta-lactamase class C family)
MASLRFVSQKLISPTAQADLQAYLTTLQPTSSTTRALNPYAVNSWNYFGVLYGNAFSGEQGFATLGQITQGGLTWDKENHVYPWFSASKIFTGVFFAKMVEEGLMNPNDTIATYISTGFSGNMTYITNSFGGTGAINTNGQPGNPAAWTVSTGSFAASTLTLNCLLNFNLGMLYDGFQYGSSGLTFTLNSTGVVLNDAAAGTDYAKNILYNAYKMNEYIFANPSTNATFQALTGADVNFTTSMYLLLQQVANGTIPLAWRPNTNADGGPTFGSTSTANVANTNVTQQPPLYVTAQLQQYSPCYELLGLAMDNKIRSLYASDPVTYPYSNFAAYARAKILTPLQMNRTFVVNQEQPSLTTPVPNIASLTYDVNAWLCTPQLIRANLSIAGGDAAYANLLNASNPQNMTIAAQYASASGARLNWACLYGNNATNTLTSLGGTGYSYNVSDDSFVKYSTAFLASPAAPLESPLGGITLCGPITDMGKLLICLLNGGKNQAGQRVLNKETVNWIFTSRTSALAPIYNPNPMSSFGPTVFAIACSRQPTESLPSANSALKSTSTFAFGGATSCRWILDRDTGYYAVFGTNIQRLWSYAYSSSFPSDYQVLRNIINKNA